MIVLLVLLMNINPLTSHGYWGTWTPWTNCKSGSHCMNGIKQRSRVCSLGLCFGSYKEFDNCHVICPQNCTFTQDYCGYTMSGAWRRISGSTPSSDTGPTQDADGNLGYYVYTEVTGFLPGFESTLSSPLFNASDTTQCFSWYYHMYGNSVGDLAVYLKVDGSETEIWKRTGSIGNEWKKAVYQITATEPFQILFVSKRGNSYSGDIALDNLVLTEGLCMTKKNCTFTEDDCGYTMDGAWRHISGSTPSRLTGPTHDADGNLGYYVYTEVSGFSPGFESRLLSPLFDASYTTQCFSWYYHMYGYLVGDLAVYLKVNGTETKIWIKTGSIGNEWKKAVYEVTAREPFQILFVSKRGNSYSGDNIALDNLVLTEGHCSDGNWSTWVWSSCSKSCGGGIAKKYRRCDSPLSRYGGRNCTRDDGSRGVFEILNDTCNTYPCIDVYTCGDNPTAEFGVMTSPNYPYNYPNNHLCTSVINVDVGSFIQIYIEFLDIEYHSNCGYDYLEIIDGSPSSFHKYCKSSYNMTNTTLCSSNGKVTIKFKSDPFVNGKGFKLSWKAFDGDDHCVSCRAEANVSYSTIPSYCRCKADYGNTSFCPGAWSSWMAEPCSKTCGDGVQMKSRKHMFYYDRSENITVPCVTRFCPADGNWSTWVWSSCSKSCGGGIAKKYRRCDSPPPRYGGRNCTRDDGSRGVFEILNDICNTYPCIDVYTCGDNPTAEFGVITSPNYPYNYPNNHLCTSVINVNVRSFIQIYIEFLDIEYHSNCGYDYLEIIDGSPSFHKYCKSSYNMTNITLCSSNAKVTIKFKSDRFANGKGFKLSWKAFDGDDECVSCRVQANALYPTIPSYCRCKADYGNVSFCPGGWSSWIAGPCSYTCGGGVQTKTRRNMFFYNRSEDITVQCNTNSCPGATTVHTSDDGSVLIIITLPIFSGTIRNYDIIVTELGLVKDFPRLSPTSYKASDIDNNVDGLYVAGRTYDINMFGKEFVVGKRGRQRRSLPAVQNKALKNDTYYGIFVRGYRNDFVYESTQWYPPVKIHSNKEGNDSKENDDITIIIIAVSLSALIIIMMIISITICFYHKKRRPKPPIQQNEERGDKNLAFDSDVMDSRAVPSAPLSTLDISPSHQVGLYADIGEQLLTSIVATTNGVDREFTSFSNNGSSIEKDIQPGLHPPRLPPRNKPKSDVQTHELSVLPQHKIEPRNRPKSDVLTHEVWALPQRKIEKASNETLYDTVESEVSNFTDDNSHDEEDTDSAIENNVHLQDNLCNDNDSPPIEGKQEIYELTDMEHNRDYNEDRQSIISELAEEEAYPDDTSDDEHPQTTTYENLPPNSAFANHPPVNENIIQHSSEDLYTGIALNENDTPIIYETLHL